MKLKTLRLNHFRNYHDQTIMFSNGINLLCGDNAQGKTNLIEAIFLLSTGKSHRTKNLSELIKQGEDYFSIDADFENDLVSKNIQLKYGKRFGKKLSINEVPKTHWSELFGYLHAILFSPESMDVVKGGPFERRRFIDILLCQLDAAYLRALQQYTAVLRMKTAVLRNRNIIDQYKDMIPVWNESLAKFGGIIAYKRQTAVKILEKYAVEQMQILSRGKENIHFSVSSFYKTDEIKTNMSYQELLLEKLEYYRPKEIEAGRSLVGVQRDEILISLNELPARLYASQGQQRSIALSLILSSMNLYNEWSGHLPILLLDDVMSELDPFRQSYLLSMLSDTQTIITTTELNNPIEQYKSLLPDKLSGQITRYLVKNAQVDPIC